MAKVVRNVSLDYDVVEEFRLTQQKGKLSGIINDLLRNYLNVQKNELQPKEKLERRKKMILESKAAIDAELLDVRTQLMEHDNKESEYTSVKETYWNQFILQKLPKFPREKYDAHYEEKFQQKAIEYSRGKK